MGALADQTVMTAMDNMSIGVMNAALTSAGLVIGSSATTAVKIANTVTYQIAGIFYSKTTAEIAFTAGAASNIANGFEQVFMLTLDTSGNGLLVPGAPSLGAGTALIPERPSIAYAPVGYVRIYCGGASTFTGGTTALSATGLVVTYYNGYPLPLFASAF